MNEFLTPHKVTAILQAYGLKPTKRFGQNFLIDRNILNKMLTSAEVTSNNVIIEVGPGLGALTSELSERAKAVYAIEADPDLIPYLTDTFNDESNVNLIFGDGLDLSNLTSVLARTKDLGSAASSAGLDITGDIVGEASATDTGNSINKDLKLIANLPYNIATALIQKYLQEVPEISEFYFLVQKEVAERMTSSEGCKSYGYYTILIKTYGEAKILFDVKPGSFYPPPRIVSSFVRIKRHKLDLKIPDQFLKIVEAAFISRRKKALNSLSANLHIGKEEITRTLEKSGLSVDVRAEDIPFEKFVTLGQEISKIVR